MKFLAIFLAMSAIASSKVHWAEKVLADPRYSQEFDRGQCSVLVRRDGMGLHLAVSGSGAIIRENVEIVSFAPGLFRADRVSVLANDGSLRCHGVSPSGKIYLVPDAARPPGTCRKVSKGFFSEPMASGN